MEIQLVDVTLHIDQSLDDTRRRELEDFARAVDGVVSVAFAAGKPHLLIVQYNPQKSTSAQILERVKSFGVHTELLAM